MPKKENEINFSCEIPDTEENRKAFQSLRDEILDGESTFYMNDMPIAVIKRHPECPRNLYYAFMQQILKV